MDFRVEWSPEAVEDVESIAEYIGRDSVFYACVVVTKIVGATRNFKLFPKMGRVVPEVGDETVRECFVYSYRLMYRVEAERVLVVAVVHGKRSFESVEDRFGAGESGR
jgi:addiction module RelE/StbE family toxin